MIRQYLSLLALLHQLLCGVSDGNLILHTEHKLVGRNILVVEVLEGLCALLKLIDLLLRHFSA